MTFDENENVIDLGQASLERKRRFPECRHLNIEVDDVEETVWCRDCGIQLTPFFALRMLSNYWRDMCRLLKVRENKVAALENKQARLRAVLKIERAWRGPHKMAVCCPHCNRGILPEDGLGDGLVGAQFEIARRQKSRER